MNEKNFERVFREQVIDTYPIVILRYKKLKSMQDEGKNLKDLGRIKEKLNKAVMIDLVAELCDKYGVTVEGYMEWFTNAKNEYVKIHFVIIFLEMQPISKFNLTDQLKN